MLKNTKDIIFLHFFSDYSYGMRLVPTYILSAKDIRLLGKFHPDSFKTERLVCLETDGQTDMARSTRLAMPIKNIYTLWGGNVSFTALQTSDWNQYTLCKGIKSGYLLWFPVCCTFSYQHQKSIFLYRSH